MTTLAEGTTPFRDGETWYAVSEPANRAPGSHLLPLVVLHGGPGMTHDYHLLGHSWGGMLAQEFTFTRPAGRPASQPASQPAKHH